MVGHHQSKPPVLCQLNDLTTQPTLRNKLRSTSFCWSKSCLPGTSNNKLKTGWGFPTIFPIRKDSLKAIIQCNQLFFDRMAIRFQTKTTNFQWQCFQSDDDSQIFTNESKLVGNHQTSSSVFSVCLSWDRQV